ncbi:MAG: transposase [Tannerella sp.]|jgi:REP element-mobilizing transposase RayT|nr:transposase [Tannerella sp.]
MQHTVPFEHGGYYHVYNKGNNNENLFVEERNYALFLSLLKKYVLPDADIYAYCLMKNHFHLLVRINDVNANTTSSHIARPYLGFSHALNAYTQSINNAYNRQGSLFSKYLKRIRITDETYLREVIVYIHLNPVKHGFSTGVEYPHSSYNTMISTKPTNLCRDEVIKMFGDVENFIYWHDYKKIQHLIKNESENEHYFLE